MRSSLLSCIRRKRGPLRKPPRRAAQRTAPARLPSCHTIVLAREIARTGKLVGHRLPIDIAAFDVSAFWHERFDADPASEWMRAQLTALFAG